MVLSQVGRRLIIGVDLPNDLVLKDVAHVRTCVILFVFCFFFVFLSFPFGDAWLLVCSQQAVIDGDGQFPGGRETIDWTSNPGKETNLLTKVGFVCIWKPFGRLDYPEEG